MVLESAGLHRSRVPDGAGRQARHGLGEIVATRVATRRTLRDTKEFSDFAETCKTRRRPHSQQA